MELHKSEIEGIFFRDGVEDTSLSALGDLFKDAKYVFADMYVLPADETETLMKEEDVYDTVDMQSVHVLLKAGANVPSVKPDNFVYYTSTQRNEFAEQVRFPNEFPYSAEVRVQPTVKGGADLHELPSLFVKHMRDDAVFIDSNKDRIIDDALESGYCVLYSDETVFSPSLIGSAIYELSIKALNKLSHE